MANADRGFGSMDVKRQKEIASKGGIAAHKKGTAHEWTSDEAVIAGRKGGIASRGGRGRVQAPAAGEVTETPSRGQATENA